jgi:hypothetical protein
MAHSSNTVRNVLFIAFAVVLLVAVLAALVAGGGAEEGYGEGVGSGDTQFYDGGSITDTGDGLIYSDENGNSYSTGG